MKLNENYKNLDLYDDDRKVWKCRKLYAGKKAKNIKEARKIQETYKNKPHAWTQWKGTNICMDVHCKCGYHSHLDASFAYHIKCFKCGTVYLCNGHIELIELEEEPEDFVCITED